MADGHGDEAVASTPSGTEVEISAELEAKFNEVFSKDSDSEVREAKPATPASKRPEQRRAEQQAVESEELEGLEQQTQGEPGEKPEGEEAGEAPDPNKPAPKTKTSGEQAATDENDPIATLPPLLRQVAKRADWTDEDLRRALDLDPEATTKTLQRILSSFNDVSARFGVFGQQQQQMQQQSQQPQFIPQFQQQQAPPQQQQQRQAQQLPNQLTPDAILQHLYGNDYKEKFTLDYGENFIPQVLSPLAQMVVAPVMAMQQQAEMQRRHETAMEINRAFEQVEGDLPEQYGNLKKGRLSNEQIAFRTQVLEVADRIRTGAQFQGVPMTVAEAIQNAHFQVAAGHLQQIERQKLTQQVRNRQNRHTARPTGRGAITGTPRPKSDQAAIEAAQTKGEELGLFDGN